MGKLGDYRKALLQAQWPLPDASNAELFLDVGIDPSMSSSGICLILRRGGIIINCKVLNPKTFTDIPVPLRLGSILDALHIAIMELMSEVDPGKIHITALVEIPPTTLSSSGWLFALCQMLWLYGFEPEAPSLVTLYEHQFYFSIHQWGINVPQLKNIYLGWAKHFGITATFREISQKKSLVVQIINKVIDETSLRPFLPKRFNNDIAEGIALALCAGGCSRLKTYDFDPTIQAPYPLVPMEELHSLMTNKKVNKHNQRVGWVYRPLEYSFGWELSDIVPPVC